MFLILTAALPALVITLFSGLRHREHEIFLSKQDIMHLVQSLAAQHEQIADSTRLILQTLAQLPEVQKNDVETCNRIFRDIHEKNPIYSIIAAATPDGDMFAASAPITPGSVNFAERKHIRDVIRTRDFSAGEYIVGKVSMAPAISFTFPVLDKNGELIAIAIGSLKLDKFKEFMTQLKLPEGYMMSIVDHKNILLYRFPENERTPIGMPIPLETAQRVPDYSREGFVEGIGRDGVSRIYAYNLMSNAVKFTAAGDIQLEARVQRRTAADVDLEISVQDTGIGMTEDELSRLFTAFAQADASTTRRFGGSGLGLAISRQLVELMGGTIRAESTPDKGSLFTVVISFLIASDVALLAACSQMPQEHFTDVRALVAEDHAINREIIVELLRQAGIEADIAINGREAVERVRAQDYDVLFMDIQMPEMDGFTATREIRNMGREGVDRLPILALSSYAVVGDREKSIAAGMNDHLSKPIDSGALSAALRRWLPPEKCVAVTVDEPDLFTKPDFMSIPSLHGLDVEGGLNRMGGKMELYLKLLRDFVAGYGETPELLLDELRADRRKDAIHRVHAIRGVAGSLGGKELEAAAAELEKACQAAENMDNCIPFAVGEPLRVFIDNHKALITAIGVVLVRQPVVAAKPESPPGTDAELRPLLKQLKIALTSKEPLPCKKILEVLLKRRWSEDHESGLAEVNRLVQQYRLAEALAFLNNEFDDVMEKTEERDDD